MVGPSGCQFRLSLSLVPFRPERSSEAAVIPNRCERPERQGDDPGEASRTLLEELFHLNKDVKKRGCCFFLFFSVSRLTLSIFERLTQDFIVFFILYIFVFFFQRL